LHQTQKPLVNRSRTDIVVQILQITNAETGKYEEHEDDGIIQTKIMYKAFLPYAQMKEYLRVLTENDLLSYNSSSRKFRTTKKGRRFLKIYNKMGNVMIEERQI
jgi:predicted transcriptional regulator